MRQQLAQSTRPSNSPCPIPRSIKQGHQPAQSIKHLESPSIILCLINDVKHDQTSSRFSSAGALETIPLMRQQQLFRNFQPFSRSCRAGAALQRRSICAISESRTALHVLPQHPAPTVSFRTAVKQHMRTSWHDSSMAAPSFRTATRGHVPASWHVQLLSSASAACLWQPDLSHYNCFSCEPPPTGFLAAAEDHTPTSWHAQQLLRTASVARMSADCHLKHIWWLGCGLRTTSGS